MSLLVTVFLLVLVTELVLYAGYAHVTALVYEWYLVATKDPKIAKHQKLKQEVLMTKAELSKTSSQDEFAKWAKIRRKLDKGLADVEALGAEIAYNKTAFELKAKSAVWCCVHGSQWLMVLWFRKSAVVYLPPHWFGPMQWILSMPFAPAGSVSVAVWFSVCRRSIKAVAGLVSDFIPATAKPHTA
ncbi:WRB/Get1 family [Spinellus fusiger]|nr:WRB/Get1 family [Spinellus fusiger]